MELRDLHCIVIGAGIGGLAAGAMLARRGVQVVVLEAQRYAGGCAATFSSGGYRFDAGRQRALVDPQVRDIPVKTMNELAG